MAVTIPQVRVGEPIRHKALSVFPLFTEPNGSVDYLLADEAIRDQMLAVQEVSEGGSVPELLVENKGDFRVLFIEGEELVGAKQNRILNTSILVAAKSKTKIPVSCVEHGRWGYKSKFFGSSGSHSPSKLRYALKASVTQSLKEDGTRQSDQGEVWNQVGELHAVHRVQSPTGAMADAFDAYKDQVAEFQEKLKYVEGASGMAVVIGKKVVGCDLFDKPSTCRKVWDRLLVRLGVRRPRSKGVQRVLLRPPTSISFSKHERCGMETDSTDRRRRGVPSRTRQRRTGFGAHVPRFARSRERAGGMRSGVRSIFPFGH